MLNHLKNALCGLLAIAIIAPSVFFALPQKAEAETTSCFAGFLTAIVGKEAAKKVMGLVNVPVGDQVNSLDSSTTSAAQYATLFKECIFKPLAIMLAKAAIRSIGASVVNWINNGFQGSPAFLSDPQNFFLDVADQAIGNFIEGSALGFLCGSFQLDIRLSLGKLYRPYDDRSRCTLSQIADNLDPFDSIQSGSGGWDGWLARTLEPQNNVYGSYLEAKNELSIRVKTAQGKEIKLLDFGQGFLSFKRCTYYEADKQANQNFEENAGLNPNADESDLYDSAAPSSSSKGACLQEEVVTPGRVIGDKLQSIVSEPEISLAIAQEIDQVLGALANQLVTQIIQTGLGALSKNRAGTNKSYLSSYQSDTLSGSVAQIRNSSSLQIQEVETMYDQAGRAAEAEGNSIVGTGNSLAGAERDLARGKQARQSSISSGFTASGAVDGNTTGTAASYSALSVTGEELSPWWEVDLGSSSYVRSVDIWRRTDVSAALSLGKFRVIATDANGGNVWQSPVIEAKDSDTVPLKVQVGETRQIIRIQREPASYQTNCRQVYSGYDQQTRQPTYTTTCDTRYYQLQLAEVDVNGTDVATTFSPAATTVTLGNSDSFSQKFELKIGNGDLPTGYDLYATLYKGTEAVPWGEGFDDLDVTVTENGDDSSIRLNDDGKVLLSHNVGLSASEPVTIEYDGRANHDQNSDSFVSYSVRTELVGPDGKVAASQNTGFVAGQ